MMWLAGMVAAFGSDVPGNAPDDLLGKDFVIEPWRQQPLALRYQIPPYIRDERPGLLMNRWYVMVDDGTTMTGDGLARRLEDTNRAALLERNRLETRRWLQFSTAAVLSTLAVGTVSGISGRPGHPVFVVSEVALFGASVTGSVFLTRSWIQRRDLAYTLTEAEALLAPEEAKEGGDAAVSDGER